MDLSKMSRKELFRYGKAKGVRLHATMKNEDIIRVLQGEVPEPTKKEKRKVKDKNRVPLGQLRSRLGNIGRFNISDDKVPRWVNDHPGRVHAALEGGYQFVQDPKKIGHVGDDPLNPQGLSTAVKTVVGEKQDGSPLDAYLMVIDRDLYEEDQEFKQRELELLDESIKAGAVKPGEGQYVPKEGITYDTQKN